MKPTPEQIKAEIESLQSIKFKVREYSAFGDNHRDAIEAQIKVLEDDLLEDEIYNRADESLYAEEEVWTESVKDAALEVRQWLDGDMEETPTENWASLIQ